MSRAAEAARAEELAWCWRLEGSPLDQLRAITGRAEELLVEVASRQPIGVTEVEGARYAALVGEAEGLSSALRAVEEERARRDEIRRWWARGVVERRARVRRLARGAVRLR